MKNIKQIEEVISNYNSLIEFAKAKIKVLEKLDPAEFDTIKGIIDIFFDEDGVNVKCDSSSWGCYDTSAFIFPLHYLALSDDDLKKEVDQKKEERLEKERQRKIKQEEEQRRKDINEYDKLKTKLNL